jgi:hypothetical protein
MTDDTAWRFRRAVARVESAVDEIVADFATSYVGRPVRRNEILPPRPLPGIAWSIDGVTVVAFVHRQSGRDQLFVYDIALLDDVKRRFRTRHVDVEYVPTAWDTPP